MDQLDYTCPDCNCENPQCLMCLGRIEHGAGSIIKQVGDTLETFPDRYSRTWLQYEIMLDGAERSEYGFSLEDFEDLEPGTRVVCARGGNDPFWRFKVVQPEYHVQMGGLPSAPHIILEQE